MGFLLSPRAFMTAGSGIGLSGEVFFVVLALLALLHSSIAYNPEAALPDNTKMLTTAAGYGIRSFTLAFLSCSILGIAGYAFNEVYLYWFPNFLFSFIILGCSFFVSLTSAATFRKIQMTAVLFVLIGVVVLVFASIGAPEPAQAENPEFYSARALSPFKHGLIFMASLLIGYELLNKEYADLPIETQKIILTAAILAAALLFAFFASAIFSVSGAAKLADSTVPHMIGARKIFGQPGRYIMGGVIILGSFVAFNTVVRYLKRPFDAAIDSFQASGPLRNILIVRLSASAVPVLAVSVLMLMGFAGEPVTETYIAGGLGFWMLFYAATNLCAFARANALGKASICISSAFCAYLGYGIVMSTEEVTRAFLTPLIFTIVVGLIDYAFKKRLPS